MERNERLAEIIRAFDSAAETFRAATGGITVDISSDYKAEETPEELKHRYARIYYGSFALIFRYTAHGLLGIVNSILECMVCADKSDEAIPIPLPIVADYMDIDIELPMCVPCITDGEGMSQAFRCIGDAAGRIIQKLPETLSGTENRDRLVKFYIDELNRAFKADIRDHREDEISSLKILAVEEITAEELLASESEMYCDFVTDRLTSNLYLQYMKGKPLNERRVRKLKNNPKALGCERRMAGLWQKDWTFDISELSAIQDSLDLYDSHGVQRGNSKELIVLLVSIFALTFVFFPVYYLIYRAVLLYESRDAVFLLVDQDAGLYTFLMAMVTGCAASYFTRIWFACRIFGGISDSYEATDQITNSSGTDRFMRGLLGLIVSVCLVVSVLGPMHNIKFTDGGFWDNREFFSLRGIHHSYAEIEEIRLKRDKSSNSSSYVMVLRGGTEIDLLDLNYELSAYKGDIDSIMDEHGISVRK